MRCWLASTKTSGQRSPRLSELWWFALVLGPEKQLCSHDELRGVRYRARPTLNELLQLHSRGKRPPRCAHDFRNLRSTVVQQSAHSTPSLDE
jgi:hypothetical protein